MSEKMLTLLRNQSDGKKKKGWEITSLEIKGETQQRKAQLLGGVLGTAHTGRKDSPQKG